jgi:hypothetical protein
MTYWQPLQEIDRRAESGRLAGMTDPTDDTVPPFDGTIAISCAACGKHTDDPETDGWAFDEDELNWICHQCADGESDQPLGAE